MQLVSGSSPSVSRPGDWCDEEVVCVDAFGSAIKATVVSDSPLRTQPLEVL